MLMLIFRYFEFFAMFICCCCFSRQRALCCLAPTPYCCRYYRQMLADDAFALDFGQLFYFDI